MRDDQKSELRRIQEMSIDHAIDEMDEAHGRTIDNPEDRGDRYFLTGMASRSLKIAMQVEQFIALRDRPDMYKTAANQEENDKAVDRMVARAQAKITDIKSVKKKTA
jgi:hypothetical protein